MHGLRFLLILALTVLMDLGSPILPEASDGLEEFEGAAHGRRRVLARLMHAAPRQTTRPAVVAASVTGAVPAWRRSPRRSPTAAARKLPPLRSDPASTSEDH
jgi:hypothetical protein